MLRHPIDLIATLKEIQHSPPEVLLLRVVAFFSFRLRGRLWSETHSTVRARAFAAVVSEIPATFLHSVARRAECNVPSSSFLLAI